MIPPLPDLISEHGFGHRSSNNRFVVEYIAHGRRRRSRYITGLMNFKVLASLGASLHLFASPSHTALPTLVIPSMFWRRRRRRSRRTSKILQDCVPDDSENTILQHPILTKLWASSSSSGAQSSKALLRGFILLSFMLPNLLVPASFPGQNPTLRGSTWGPPSHTLSHVFRPQLSRTVRRRIVNILLISTPGTQFVRGRQFRL